MSKYNPKTESLSEKQKKYQTAFEFWAKYQHLTRVDVCLKFGITESAMRSHMKRYGIQHPRELITKPIVRGSDSDRKAVVRNAYNMALEQNLSATQASSWATQRHKSKISRAEIQFYATKFDLPYLRESENFEMGRLCKYA